MAMLIFTAINTYRSRDIFSCFLYFFFCKPHNFLSLVLQLPIQQRISRWKETTETHTANLSSIINPLRFGDNLRLHVIGCAWANIVFFFHNFKLLPSFTYTKSTKWKWLWLCQFFEVPIFNLLFTIDVKWKLTCVTLLKFLMCCFAVWSHHECKHRLYAFIPTLSLFLSLTHKHIHTYQIWRQKNLTMV